MVNYEAEIYDTSDNNLVGIRVQVASDVGDVIEDIQVTNKTEFDALAEQLDEIDERYIKVEDGSSLAGVSLDTILANSDSTTNINASKLGGHSDTYYAPVVHSHTAGDINNLYQYEIRIDNYAPKVGEQVSVTVKVTDYQDRNVKKLITIYKDNDPWATNVSTNTKGEYTKTFTPTEAGTVTFSIKNAKAQCIVQDVWKQVNLLKTMSFECQLWILESQKLANLVMYIPRYVGWCKSTKTSDMDPDEKDPDSLPYIGENGTNNASKGYVDAVAGSKRRYLFNGRNTENVLPLEYCPSRTISQPLYRGDFVVYLHRDGSLSGMAKAYSTTSAGKNWSVDVHFNQVWRYENEE